MSASPVPGALAAARLRALRMALLALHKALLDAERARYERVHGRVDSPGRTLQLVMTDPAFAWLRPISALIVQADEQLDSEAGVRQAEVEAFSERMRDLLQGRLDGVDFAADYQRSLQEAPDVVLAHGRLAGLLAQPPEHPDVPRK
jgi:hypothetical protein